MWMTHLEMATVQGFWLHYHLLLWIIFMCLTSPVIPEMVYRVDPLGRLITLGIRNFYTFESIFYGFL